MRRIVFLAASLIVSALFLWLALRDVPFADVLATIREANVGWVLASAATIFVALWVRAIRWRGLIGFKIPQRRAFYILTVTFLLNQLPLRAGEVARSLLATQSGVPFMTAATSILVERLLDTLMVVLLLLAALTRLPSTLPAASQAATLFGVASVAAFVVLIIFARYPTFARRVLAALETRLPFLQRLRLRRLLDQVLAGLEPLTRWRSASHAIGWTVISWGVSLVTFYLLELALGVSGIDLGLMALLAVTLASFSIAIPVSVAAIGPFELAVKLAGEGMGLPDVQATSLGFLFHGVTILSYAVMGIIGLLTLGVSLSEMMGAKAETETAVAAEGSKPPTP